MLSLPELQLLVIGLSKAEESINSTDRNNINSGYSGEVPFYTVASNIDNLLTNPNNFSPLHNGALSAQAHQILHLELGKLVPKSLKGSSNLGESLDQVVVQRLIGMRAVPEVVASLARKPTKPIKDFTQLAIQKGLVYPMDGWITPSYAGYILWAHWASNPRQSR